MEDEFPILIETYIEDCDQRIEGLSHAIASQNSTEGRELAHAFKGSSSNLGAPHLADIWFVMETMGRDGNLTDASETLNAIKTEYQIVKNYFSSLL